METAGADGLANGEFATTGFKLGKEETGQVEATNQEDKEDCDQYAVESGP